MAAPQRLAELRIRVTDLRRHTGSRSDEVATVAPGELSIGDAAVVEEPIELTLALESLTDGVKVTGSAEFGWTGMCRRCLEPATGRATTTFTDLFVDDPERYSSATEEAEIHQISDGFVALGDVVRDALLLGLPLAPLCGRDCAGPAPTDFPVTAGEVPDDEQPDGGDDDSPSGGDPRWAALSELRFDPVHVEPGHFAPDGD